MTENNLWPPAFEMNVAFACANLKSASEEVVRSLENERVALKQLENLVAKCGHQWSEPIEQQKAKGLKSWVRTCSICKCRQETHECTQEIVYVPDFSSRTARIYIKDTNG